MIEKNTNEYIFDYPSLSFIEKGTENSNQLNYKNKDNSKKTFEEEYNSGKIELDQNYFYNLELSNKNWFDCGNALPLYFSVNNGVFLCSNCSQNHSKLDYNISFIRKVNDVWDPYLLAFATRGGNSRFFRLCKEYGFDCMSSIENEEQKLRKYVTILGEYHRLLLKSEILGEVPPDKPDINLARNPITKQIDYFPEFKNYKLYEGELNIDVSNNKTNLEKFYETGKEYLQSTIEKSKPILSYLKSKTFQGIHYIGSNLINYFSQKRNQQKD